MPNLTPPELIEKQVGYIDQEEVEQKGEAETAVCRLLLNFRRREGFGPRDAGYVKAIIYFINKKDYGIPEDVEHDFRMMYPIRESERNGSSGAIAFTRMIDPASTCRESLLCLNDAFDKGSAFFVDIDLHLRFKIVRIELEEAVQLGRVCRVSIGQHCLGMHDHWTNEHWIPTWSQRLNEGGQKDSATGAASLLGLAPAKSVLNIPLSMMKPCDSLRIELTNSEKDAWFPEMFLAAKLEAEPRGPKLTLLRTSEKRQQLVIDEIPSGTSNIVEKCLPDIWYSIVNTLPAENRLKALVALSGTNRRMRDIFRHPSLYTTVDLKELSPVNLSEPLLNFIAERATQPRNFRVAWLQHVPEGVDFQKFLRRLPPSMATFVAEACPIIDDTVLRTLIETQPNLETLDLSRCHAISPEAFRCIASLRELRRVSFYDTAVSEKSLIMIFDQCHKLEVVNIGALQYFGDMHSGKKLDDVVAKLAENCGPTTLKALYLNFVNLTNKCLANRVLTRCGRLEELFLGYFCGAGEWNSETYRLLAVSCPRMRRLAIGLINRLKALVKNTDVVSFSKHLTKLEHLTLVPTDANASTIADLLDNCPQLTHLAISSENVSSDAVKALREEYPRCVIDYCDAPKDRHPVNDEDDEDEWDSMDEEEGEEEGDDEFPRLRGGPDDEAGQALVAYFAQRMAAAAEEEMDEDWEAEESDEYDESDYEEGDYEDYMDGEEDEEEEEEGDEVSDDEEEEKGKEGALSSDKEKTDKEKAESETKRSNIDEVD